MLDVSALKCNFCVEKVVVKLVLSDINEMSEQIGFCSSFHFENHVICVEGDSSSGL